MHQTFRAGCIFHQMLLSSPASGRYPAGFKGLQHSYPEKSNLGGKDDGYVCVYIVHTSVGLIGSKPAKKILCVWRFDFESGWPVKAPVEILLLSTRK